MEKKALTPKANAQRRAFVDNYLQDFNGGRAYSEVYPSNSSMASCRTKASNLLTQGDIQQYLQEKLQERKQQLHVDQSYVVRKLIDISEIDYVDSIRHLTRDELEKIPKEVRKLIQSIDLLKTSTNNDQGEFKTEKYKVTFMSKDKALELLGKHTGAFMRDNVQGQYDLGRMSFTDALNELDV